MASYAEDSSSSATCAASSADTAGAPDSPSPPSSRRAAPTLLLLASLAALIILSSGDDGTAHLLKDVSLGNPEVSFVPSPFAGQFCERVRLSGVPRNASMGLCQCEVGEWQVFQDGLWTAVNSPYGNKYVDVKLADKKSARFTLSIQEVCTFTQEFAAGSFYSDPTIIDPDLALVIGDEIVTNGEEKFILPHYLWICGVGSYAVHYFSTLVSSILENFGLSEEMHNPVSLFLMVTIVLTGAGFGYWMVRRFILSKDGSVDAGIAQFVKWAMRVVATFFVMQSTLDPRLAMVALASCWSVCALLTGKKVQRITTPKKKQSKVSSQLMLTQGSPSSPQVQFLSPSSKIGFGRTASRSSATQYGWSNLANGGLVSSALTKQVEPKQDEDYYSTFHNIEPRKYSKEEWKNFTQESTRKALAECTATPEFAKWVADNAHRLRVEKDDDLLEEETIESSSSSSEETGEEADGGPGLLRLWR
nr:unnamed protein product [Digitaria exilis]